MSQDSETESAFMEATYRALCEHGYADLTMQDIADETDKSKATLHYHFDGKAELFREFLAYLNEDFTDSVADPGGDTPAEQLIRLLETVLETPADGTDQQFNTAFLEIKAQAPYRDGYREALDSFDGHLHSEVRSLVAAGVDAGQFPDDTDPDHVANHVLTYIHGTWTRSAAVGSEVDALRDGLVDYVESLLADDVEVPVADHGGTESGTDDDANDGDEGGQGTDEVTA
ncbi:TetR/AcrR family transcriptional regulator [Halobaculum sp. D14]|uniref:TetR/AcrR family transcriptional regulator n=1 Tax=Halobaculum sp. D14 TaxID=3421642 RepID=UPI003EB821C2